MDTNSTFTSIPTASQPEFLRATKEFQIWQKSKVLEILPVIVLDVLFMLFGVVGNSVVCYICMFRMPKIAINSFVLVLAALELMGCVLSIPFDITEMFNSYSFNYPILCKLERYVRTVIIFSTGFILIAIATERYKRIVKPHGRHVTMSQLRLAVSGSIILSVVFAVPEAILAGSETVKTPYGHGQMCSTYHSDQYRRTVYPQLWGFLVVLIYVVSTSAIGAIYCVIGSKIWKRSKVPTDRKSKTNTPESTLQRRVRYHPYNQNISGKSGNSAISFGEFVHHNLPLQQHCSRQSIRNSSTSSSNDIFPGISPQTFQPHNEYQPALNKEVNFQHHIHKPSGNQSNPQNYENPHDDSTDDQEVFADAKNYSQDLDKKEDIQDLLHDEGGDTNEIQYGINSSSDRCMKFNYHSTQLQDRRRNVETSEMINHIQHSSASSSESSNPDQENLNRPGRYHLPHQQQKQNRPAVFFDEVIRILSQKEVKNFRYYPNSDGPEAIFSLHPITPIGSLRRKAGYSRKRTTFIMFIMTLTTALSYFPHVVVMMYRLSNPKVETHLSPDLRILFKIAWNSFFISLASHPFVYGFWNGRFKNALYSLLTGARRRRHKVEMRERSSFSSARHS